MNHEVEALTEALRGVPAQGVDSAHVYTFPGSVAQALAVHLYECGYRLVEQPARHYVPPEDGEDSWLSPRGVWAVGPGGEDK